MKSIKKTLPVLALMLLTGGIFAVDTANAKGCPMMNDCPMMHGGKHGKHNSQESNITDEQRKEARMLVEKAQESMAPMKQQLFVKEQELEALQNAATPDVSAVSKKATEIVELRQKIKDAKKDLGIAIDKALGLEPGTHSLGGGMGHGGMGHGGMGHKNMR